MLRKLKGSKYSRFIITALLIILQLAWFGVGYLELYYTVPYMPLVVTILAFAFVLYIIQNDVNPSIKLGWIMTILVLPVLGVPLYLFYGDSKPAKRMYKRCLAAQLISPDKISQPIEPAEALNNLDPRAYSTSRYIQRSIGYPLYNATETKYYPLGDVMFEDMLVALKNAKHFIFLEYFIIENGKMWDSIREILIERAKAGVEVKIIFDDVGSIAKDLPKHFDRYMESLHPNIKCMGFNIMRPLAVLSVNNRDHRKLMIIDGEIGFTGGVNLADEYINNISIFGHWKDTGVRLYGDAVKSMTLMFIELWNAFRNDKLTPELYCSDIKAENPIGFVQPFSDTPLDNETLAKNIIMDIISRANDRIFICTPYLIIDSELRSILCLAAKRGIDVRIITPGIPDKKLVFRLTRANYRPLLDAGVKIYEYTPGFLHAKSIVADGDSAIIGSVNLDYRSIYLHFECGVYMFNTEVIPSLEADCYETFEKSHLITNNDLKRGIIGTAVDSFLRAFETLL